MNDFLTETLLSPIMNIDESTYELIERYLDGDLPAGQCRALEARIESDPEFAAEVAWLRSLRTDFKNTRAFEVLDEFQAIRTRKKSILRKRRAAVAAAVALLLLSVPIVFPLILNRQTDAEILKPDAGTAEAAPAGWEDLVDFSDDLQFMSNEGDALERALNLVDQGQRQQALPLLESYLSQLPAGEEDIQNELLAGKIYLYDLRDFTRAENFFDRIIAGDALPKYKAEARYYKALSRSAQHDREGAVSLLNELRANAPEPWREKAATALQVIAPE